MDMDEEIIPVLEGVKSSIERMLLSETALTDRWKDFGRPHYSSGQQGKHIETPSSTEYA